jgi:hypothetical protein
MGTLKGTLRTLYVHLCIDCTTIRFKMEDPESKSCGSSRPSLSTDSFEYRPNKDILWSFWIENPPRCMLHVGWRDECQSWLWILAIKSHGAIVLLWEWDCAIRISILISISMINIDMSTIKYQISHAGWEERYGSPSFTLFWWVVQNVHINTC